MWRTPHFRKAGKLMSIRMSVAAEVPETTEVSLDLAHLTNSALHRMVQHVFEESFKLTPVPSNREIANALRVSVGEDAVRIWEELVEDLGL